jgi:hypothetical protein
MGKNGSSGADTLAKAVRAAGFAMATPDDRPEDTPAVIAQPLKTTWTSAAPQRALVVAAPQPVSFQTMVREWMASLTWRAPA